MPTPNRAEKDTKRAPAEHVSDSAIQELKIAVDLLLRNENGYPESLSLLKRLGMMVSTARYLDIIADNEIALIKNGGFDSFTITKLVLEWRATKVAATGMIKRSQIEALFTAIRIHQSLGRTEYAQRLSAVYEQLISTKSNKITTNSPL